MSSIKRTKPIILDEDNPQRIISAGSLVVITGGEYSAFHVVDVGRANFDIDIDRYGRVAKENCKSESRYGPTEYEIYHWLIEHNVLEPVDYFEWNVTDDVD